jgi:hypothetical protein
MKSQLTVLFLLSALLYADYPDQHREIRTTAMWNHISSNSNIVLSEDGTRLQLAEGSISGYFILLPDTLEQPFDRGLPSWNGLVNHDDSGFKVSMRFKYGTGWSPWLTVGYWQNYVWSSYGSTSYGAGYIDYDYVVLNNFHTVWQWRVELKRQLSSHPSPSIDKLSFFVSDDRTTDNLDFTAIVNDDPSEIFYPTTFVCQYNVDPEIGGSICSPTSTVLAIRSCGIEVDPYVFAVDNFDDYWNIFGIWPRAVQNAAAYHMDGAVTRYRSWSQAYDTLAIGGRIVMSVGPPLYSGHLMMLAGFDAQGDPIVHDPARQNGYSYGYNKSSLSHSWFDKGGVAYTFFPEDTAALAINEAELFTPPDQMTLFQNFPNPFNPSTTIRFALSTPAIIKITIFDIQGREVSRLKPVSFLTGTHEVSWNAASLAAGVYLVQLETGSQLAVRSMTLLK